MEADMPKSGPHHGENNARKMNSSGITSPGGVGDRHRSVQWSKHSPGSGVEVSYSMFLTPPVSRGLVPGLTAALLEVRIAVSDQTRFKCQIKHEASWVNLCHSLSLSLTNLKQL